MGHLIEEYAKNLGVKIGKPILQNHYYPILAEKYITIHCDNKIDSKNYEYFPQVLTLLKPILRHNGYKIFQIGGPEDPKLKDVDGHLLNLTFQQSSNVIKNSQLHIGIDSLPVHIASMYDIPIVAIYSHIYPANAYPYWSSKEKVIILESDKNGFKPSFSYQESPKTIRSIKPEQVAQSALNLLGLNFEINFDTLYIGSHYHIPVVEVIPNFKANIEDQKNNTIYIRSDLHLDIDNLAFWCANYKVKIIAKEVLPLDLLKHFSKNIDTIFFKISDTSISNEYFESLKRLKIKFNICTLDKENLSEFRNNYFDFNVEFDNEKERILNFKKINSNFLTSKIIISNGKAYASEMHAVEDKPLDKEVSISYDDDRFWKDAEHFYFYEQNRIQV